MNGFEVIGYGSYGSVLKGQGLALKVSSFEDPYSKGDIHGRDIVHELWVLSFLGNHENVVAVKGIWKTSRYARYSYKTEVGITMELCSRSLRNAIQTSSLVESDLFDLANQLTRGVAYLASRGVVHCDLSTGNILVDQRGNLRIADFGMARVLTKTKPRALFDDLITNETVRAPELFKYNVISPKFRSEAYPDGQFPTFGCEIDVWALGCVVYSMWQGTRVPGHFHVNDAFFQDEYRTVGKIERLELCLERIEENLKFIKFSSSTLDEWLSKFFCWTLEVDPVQRKTASFVLQELFDEKVESPSTFSQDMFDWVKEKLGPNKQLQVEWLAENIEQPDSSPTHETETEFLLKHSGFQVFDIKVPSHGVIRKSIDSSDSE